MFIPICISTLIAAGILGPAIRRHEPDQIVGAALLFAFGCCCIYTVVDYKDRDIKREPWSFRLLRVIVLAVMGYCSIRLLILC